MQNHAVYALVKSNCRKLEINNCQTFFELFRSVRRAVGRFTSVACYPESSQFEFEPAASSPQLNFAHSCLC